MLAGAKIMIDSLDEKVTAEWLKEYEFEELVAGMMAAREMVRVLRDVANRIEQAVAAEMTDKKVTVSGFGVLERNVDVTRKGWDHKALASKLVAQALLKHAMDHGGEMLDKQTAAVVLQAIEKSCRTEWRITGLGEYGIDADKYCTKEFGQPKVRVYTP